MKYFGTDGIRDKWQQIYDTAFPLGVVLSSMHSCVAVARDPRNSSFDIEKELVRGLLTGGATVYLCGVMPTPALAYTLKANGVDCGVMITASHNPPEYNGLKVMGVSGKLAEDEEYEGKLASHGDKYPRITKMNKEQLDNALKFYKQKVYTK